jgi:predicted DNA-binding protein with PD1-like motif
VQLVDPRSITRGMVRVDTGEDLVEALEALAQAAGWTDAYVTGAGELELVELTAAAGGETQTLENAQLTALSGRIQRRDGHVVVELRASVVTSGAVHSGRIAAAITGKLLLVVDAVSEVAPLPLGHHTVPAVALSAKPLGGAPALASVATERATMPSPHSQAPPASVTQPRSTFLGGASRGGLTPRAATKPISSSFKTRPIVSPVRSTASFDDGDDHENPIVNAGEFLRHPQLGLCEVVGDDDSGGTRIRVPTGKLRVLRLDALQVMPAERDDEDRMVFKITGPRKKRR